MPLETNCPSCQAPLPEGATEGSLCEACARDASAENVPTLLNIEPAASPLQRIGDYEVLGKLGQGGMGAVYRARHLPLDRMVALKILPSQMEEDENFVGRFQREATVAARLNHPNLVRVYASGVGDGCHFIAMELVEGENLRQRLKRGGVTQVEAVRICLDVARALQCGWQAAHLIHRDVKPSNIYLSAEGAVKLGDLGLAKSLLSNTTGITHTGTAIGTPHYISPEQARGEKTIDLRADIYSLGCTLYELLTGATPYRGTDPLSVMSMHLNSPPPAILKVLPQCPIPLARLVNKMLRKSRHERHQTYEELIAAMEQALEHLEQGPTATGPSPLVAAWREIGAAEQHGRVARATASPASTSARSATALSARPAGRSKLPLWLGLAAALVIGAVAFFLLRPAPHGAEGELAAHQSGATPAATPLPVTAVRPLAEPLPSNAEFFPPGPPGLVKTFDVSPRADPIWLPDGRRALVPEDQGWMQLLDLSKGQPAWRKKMPYVARVYAMPAGDRAIRAGWDGNRFGAVLMNPETGEDLASWTAEANSRPAGAHGAVSPDGRHFALGHFGDADHPALDVWVLETDTMKPVAEWHVPGALSGYTSAWLDDQRYVISPNGFRGNGDPNSLLAFDLREPHGDPRRLRLGVGHYLFTDPAHQLVAGDHDGNLTVTTVSDPTKMVVLRAGMVARCAEFVGQELVASLDAGGHLLLLSNVHGGPPVTELHPEDYLDTLSVRSDGAYALARAPGPHQLTLWRLRPTAAPATAAPVAAPSSSSGDTIHLLPLVQLPRDVVRGSWSWKGGELSLDQASGFANCELPYDPPEEYDFEVAFTPMSDGKNVNLHLWAGGAAFMWKLQAYGRTPPVYGFDLFDNGRQQPGVSTENPLTLEVGRRYTTRVSVRRTGLRGSVDGVEFVAWKGDFHHFTTEDSARLRDDRRLGLGSYGRSVLFHRADLIPVNAPTTGAVAASDSPVPATKLPPAQALAFGGHHYLFVSAQLSWEEAKAKAATMGGHLAFVKSREVHDWIIANIAMVNLPEKLTAFWIGAQKKDATSPWRWTDGTEVREFWWAPSQPDVGRNSEQGGFPAMLSYQSGPSNFGFDDSSDSAAPVRHWKNYTRGFLVEWD